MKLNFLFSVAILILIGAIISPPVYENPVIIKADSVSHLN